MKGMQRRVARRTLVLACILLFIGTTPAAAAISLDISADESGIAVNYAIPFLGSGSVVLEDETSEPGQIVLSFLVFELATIEVSIAEIIPEEPGSVKLNYSVSSAYFENSEGVVTLPFGELGAAVNLRGKKLAQTGNDRAFDAAVLLQSDETSYKIIANSLLVTGEWSGTASPRNNIIEEQVLGAMDTVLFDILIALEYKPFATAIGYEITPSMGTGDGETPQPLEGTITLPNGSYHIWFDTNR